MIRLGRSADGECIEVASDDDVAGVDWDITQPGLVYHEFRLHDGRRVAIHENDITVDAWRVAHAKRTRQP